MIVFKNRDARFPICIELNDGSIQKLTYLAAKELSAELLKILGESSEPPHPLLSDVLADVEANHRKTGNKYFMSRQQIINCTNKNNGETMILYTDGEMVFAREKSEFFNKFDIVP